MIFTIYWCANNKQRVTVIDEWTIKTLHWTLYVGFSLSWPVNRLCGILFNRFYRLEIHSLIVGIFDPACELLPPPRKELYLFTVAPVHSLWPPPPSPLPQLNVQYIQTVCVWGGGWGVMNCTVDHILQKFYTLFPTRFRTYKIASPPQTKMTSKDDIKGWCL